MEPTTAPGVQLAHYRQHNGGVTLTCLDCLGHRTFELEAVIGRLAARGVGGEWTGVRAVAGYVRQPCPRCGGGRFESRPYFPPRPKGHGWAISRRAPDG
jgi:hypothetical protein